MHWGLDVEGAGYQLRGGASQQVKVHIHRIANGLVMSDGDLIHTPVPPMTCKTCVFPRGHFAAWIEGVGMTSCGGKDDRLD